jgi:uncharacterized protein (DUF4415 family)
MSKEKHIKRYSVEQLNHTKSKTNLKKVDSLTDAELERLIAEDEDEKDLIPDWTQARLVIPNPKRSVHLRLEQNIIDFFKAQGSGHITRMQAVLKTYVDVHQHKKAG